MYKITEINERHYFACSYPGVDFAALPWESELFDCIIFPPKEKTSDLMESLLADLPFRSIDWVHTVEPYSEYWHDRIDEASVLAGMQKAIGDGKPMTAWHDDVKSLEDIRDVHNFGGQKNCLLICVGQDRISENAISRLKKALYKG